MHVLRLVREAICAHGGYQHRVRASERFVHGCVDGDSTPVCDTHRRPEEKRTSSRISVAGKIQSDAEFDVVPRVDRANELEVIEVVTSSIPLHLYEESVAEVVHEGALRKVAHFLSEVLILDREELSTEIAETDDGVPRELHAEEKRPHAQRNHSGFVHDDDETLRAGVSVQLV